MGKRALLLWFFFLQNEKENDFKDKIVNLSTINREKNFHSGYEPELPMDKSTTLTIMARGPSLQNFEAENLVNALIDL